MKRNILNRLVFIALFLLALSSCKVKKELVKTSTATGAQNGAIHSKVDLGLGLLDSIRKHQLNYSTLSVKAKAAITIGKKENNVTLNIRIRKDEAIWLSVTGLAGVEGARALITPDSIRLLDKINNVYLKKPFSFIHEYAAEELTFSMLQAMITGNCSNEFFAGKGISTTTGAQVSGAMNNVMFKLLFDNNFKVKQSQLIDSIAKQELSISYTGFNLKTGQELPQTVAIRTVAETNIAVDLEYSKPVLNQPVEMPFTVPKRFEVIN